MPILLLICFPHIFCVQKKIYHPSEIFFYDGIYDILFHILLAFRGYTDSRIRTSTTNMYTASRFIPELYEQVLIFKVGATYIFFFRIA